MKRAIKLTGFLAKTVEYGQMVESDQRILMDENSDDLFKEKIQKVYKNLRRNNTVNLGDLGALADHLDKAVTNSKPQYQAQLNVTLRQLMDLYGDAEGTFVTNDWDLDVDVSDEDAKQEHEKAAAKEIEGEEVSDYDFTDPPNDGHLEVDALNQPSSGAEDVNMDTQEVGGNDDEASCGNGSDILPDNVDELIASLKCTNCSRTMLPNKIYHCVGHHLSCEKCIGSRCNICALRTYKNGNKKKNIFRPYCPVSANQNGK